MSLDHAPAPLFLGLTPLPLVVTLPRRGDFTVTVEMRDQDNNLIVLTGMVVHLFIADDDIVADMTDAAIGQFTITIDETALAAFDWWGKKVPARLLIYQGTEKTLMASGSAVFE